MRLTVRLSFQESVVAYEEKPREHWLYDYVAQVALATTQIWWTSEVGIAFGRLEEGHENALKEYNKKQVSWIGGVEPCFPNWGPQNKIGGCPSQRSPRKIRCPLKHWEPKTIIVMSNKIYNKMWGFISISENQSVISRHLEALNPLKKC